MEVDIININGVHQRIFSQTAILIKHILPKVCCMVTMLALFKI